MLGLRVSGAVAPSAPTGYPVELFRTLLITRIGLAVKMVANYNNSTGQLLRADFLRRRAVENGNFPDITVLLVNQRRDLIR